MNTNFVVNTLIQLNGVNKFIMMFELMTFVTSMV